jgi:hypothetical protein
MIERSAREGRWRSLLEPLEYIVRKRRAFSAVEVARAVSLPQPGIEFFVPSNPLLAQMLSDLVVQATARTGDNDTAAAELRRQARLAGLRSNGSRVRASERAGPPTAGGRRLSLSSATPPGS